ncbi:hypothetical protein WN51_12122 [Melipona quadrifasciata]|uniref:Uncharacterized protein n=1 Tax=Melipona quadrifasciata TaxID=166423 RepID=A0A0N0BHT4_9HYME|nr:hypothetical protein WN51_12122 [Melipona quadrifasciata]
MIASELLDHRVRRLADIDKKKEKKEKERFTSTLNTMTFLLTESFGNGRSPVQYAHLEFVTSRNILYLDMNILSVIFNINAIFDFYSLLFTSSVRCLRWGFFKHKPDQLQNSTDDRTSQNKNNDASMTKIEDWFYTFSLTKCTPKIEDFQTYIVPYIVPGNLPRYQCNGERSSTPSTFITGASRSSMFRGRKSKAFTAVCAHIAFPKYNRVSLFFTALTLFWQVGTEDAVSNPCNNFIFPFHFIQIAKERESKRMRWILSCMETMSDINMQIVLKRYCLDIALSNTGVGKKEKERNIIHKDKLVLQSYFSPIFWDASMQVQMKERATSLHFTSQQEPSDIASTLSFSYLLLLQENLVSQYWHAISRARKQLTHLLKLTYQNDWTMTHDASAVAVVGYSVLYRTAKQQKRKGSREKGKGGGSCCGDVVDILARFASHCRGRSQEKSGPGYDDYADSSEAKRSFQQSGIVVKPLSNITFTSNVRKCLFQRYLNRIPAICSRENNRSDGECLEIEQLLFAESDSSWKLDTFYALSLPKMYKCSQSDLKIVNRSLFDHVGSVEFNSTVALTQLLRQKQSISVLFLTSLSRHQAATPNLRLAIIASEYDLFDWKRIKGIFNNPDKPTVTIYIRENYRMGTGLPRLAVYRDPPQRQMILRKLETWRTTDSISCVPCKEHDFENLSLTCKFISSEVADLGQNATVKNLMTNITVRVTRFVANGEELYADLTSCAKFLQQASKAGKRDSPMLAVIASRSLGFLFLGLPFCLGGGTTAAPLKYGTLGGDPASDIRLMSTIDIRTSNSSPNDTQQLKRKSHHLDTMHIPIPIVESEKRSDRISGTLGNWRFPGDSKSKRRTMLQSNVRHVWKSRAEWYCENEEIRSCNSWTDKKSLDGLLPAGNAKGLITNQKNQKKLQIQNNRNLSIISLELIPTPSPNSTDKFLYIVKQVEKDSSELLLNPNERYFYVLRISLLWCLTYDFFVQHKISNERCTDGFKKKTNYCIRSLVMVREPVTRAQVVRFYLPKDNLLRFKRLLDELKSNIRRTAINWTKYFSLILQFAVETYNSQNSEVSILPQSLVCMCAYPVIDTKISERSFPLSYANGKKDKHRETEFDKAGKYYQRNRNNYIYEDMKRDMKGKIYFIQRKCLHYTMTHRNMQLVKKPLLRGPAGKCFSVIVPWRKSVSLYKHRGGWKTRADQWTPQGLPDFSSILQSGQSIAEKYPLSGRGFPVVGWTWSVDVKLNACKCRWEGLMIALSCKKNFTNFTHSDCDRSKTAKRTSTSPLRFNSPFATMNPSSAPSAEIVHHYQEEGFSSVGYRYQNHRHKSSCHKRKLRTTILHFNIHGSTKLPRRIFYKVKTVIKLIVINLLANKGQSHKVILVNGQNLTCPPHIYQEINSSHAHKFLAQRAISNYLQISWVIDDDGTTSFNAIKIALNVTIVRQVWLLIYQVDCLIPTEI